MNEREKLAEEAIKKITATNSTIYLDEVLDFINNPHGLNRRAKTIGDLRVFLMSCDDEELTEFWDKFL